jgi:hypothetical protein
MEEIRSSETSVNARPTSQKTTFFKRKIDTKEHGNLKVFETQAKLTLAGRNVVIVTLDPVEYEVYGYQCRL